MEQRNRLIKSILGGFFISLGGTCFLSVDNKILGAFLFSLGLYAICCTKQLLFTGRASYTNNIFELATILCGNYIGANIGGLTIGYIKPECYEKALNMCANKLDSFGIQTFIVAIFCNILIYIAVEGFKYGQALLLILCVMAFIICSFEHSIADIYYFSVARMYKPIHLFYILVVILGNFAGGQMIRIVNNIINKEKL